MITKFKIFENQEELKIGDYVILQLNNDYYNNVYVNFTANNIGKIIDKNFGEIEVRYNKHPLNFQGKNQTLVLRNHEFKIIGHSSDIKDLEYILQANKYNL
jgi:hypothetical protein